MNIQKLKNGLCPIINCGGYLHESILQDKREVMRCKECHNWIDKGDYDVLVSQVIEEKIVDEVENNLEKLNNL